MNHKPSEIISNTRINKNGRRTLFFAVLVFLIFIVSGGCCRSGSWLLKDDVPVHADAIVILMGSFPERVLQAVDLYREGKADRIIIVEEYMGPFRQLEERGVDILSNTEQAVKSLVSLGVPADSIILLPGDARSTLDEARSVGRYISLNRENDTLLLVSSSAHTRRAWMIFKTALGTRNNNLCIGVSPSAYSGFNPDRWWRRKEDIQTVITEYLKIASFILFEKRNKRTNE